MRVKIKLLNQGVSNNPYWWVIVQPQKKKLTGRRIEKIGLWAIRKRKTVPR